MRLYKYISEYGYLRTDYLIRKGSLKIVYKGHAAFVYPN